jgi:hypothetical protein
MKSSSPTNGVVQLMPRKWVVALLLFVIFTVNTLLFFSKFELSIRWPVRSTHIPAFTMPKPLPFENKKFKHVYGIPKVIHQSWKDKNVPEIFKSWQAKWQQYHPDWEYHLWTDDDNRELVKKHYPHFLSTYDSFPMGVMRADSARYMYMHLYGGLYADLDMDPLRTTEELLSTIDLNPNKPNAILGYMGVHYTFRHNVPNAWMISTPGHPFWLFCIAKIMQLTSQGYNGAERLTGPVMLFEALQEYNEAQRRITGINSPGPEKGVTNLHDVIILKPGMIYPVDWHMKVDAVKNTDCMKKATCKELFPDAFTITYWTHSWE